MDKRKKYLYAVLIFFLIASLAISLRSFLMATIIEPVALLIWIGWRILISVDQQIYWMILFVICTLLMIRTLSHSQDDLSLSAYDEPYRPPSRLEFWKTLIENSALGRKENEKLRNSLKHLYLKAITRDGLHDTRSMDDFMAEHKTIPPPAVEQFLFPAHGNFDKSLLTNHPVWVALLPSRPRKWVMRLMPQDNSMIDEVLTWMETELEIKDDN